MMGRKEAYQLRINVSNLWVAQRSLFNGAAFTGNPDGTVCDVATGSPRHFVAA